mgnify:CR=1 FL=1
MILSNCTKTRTFSRYVYGDCILSLWRKSHFQRLEHKCFFAIITMIFGLFLKNGHASQTFFRRPLKKIFSGQHRKYHMSFLCCASGGIRIPGRYRYLFSRPLLSVLPSTERYIWCESADTPE